MRNIDLRFSDGRVVTIRELRGHYADKEVDFELDGTFVGGNDPSYRTALANAIEGVERRKGERVVAFKEGGAGWTVRA